MHIYIYIYIHTIVCVCVYVCLMVHSKKYKSYFQKKNINPIQ